MAIEMIKIRARIEIGSLRVETPYVQSFNVRKQRGQVSTFDASLKVSHDTVGGLSTGSEVRIYAGSSNSIKLIFTGICRNAKISPCYDDPKYVILSVGGADSLSFLAGKKYTRRCRSTQSTWVSITGVVREGLKSGKFAYTNEPTLEITSGEIQKADALTAYIGTAISDRTAPGEVPYINVVNPPKIGVVLLNQTPVTEEPTGGE